MRATTIQFDRMAYGDRTSWGVLYLPDASATTPSTTSVCPPTRTAPCADSSLGRLTVEDSCYA